MKFKTEVSAGGIVYKKEDSQLLWLITQHSKYTGWGFPKGLVGDKVRNESNENAALREVKEEGGVEAKIFIQGPIEIHYMYRFQEYLIKKTVYYFVMEYISGDPKDHDWEVSDAQFLSEEKVLEMLSFKNDKEAFRQAIDTFKSL
jgi:8-oxo-dGTP pyrophosphatase MutT (NUDIX family)